ncbi:MAG: RNA ligase family protein [Candidatus Berkelbacteria bacterium]|nr:RNA ligase family protein [Candidatus Berkelbacteria bacterium]
MDFQGFPKIPRLSRNCVITEKIDGTNASICIGEDGSFLVGSRTRWITPEQDNQGFARWANEHKDELIVGLGFGHHFGEWWGAGIQRRYDLKEKRFSLFNTGRWTEDNKPQCCYIVPVLAVGVFSTHLIEETLDELAMSGSVAAPGFMKPEGIVIYHEASRSMFKKTIEKDEGKESA